MEPIRSMEELVVRAKQAQRRRLVVPAAEAGSALSAAVEARKQGLCDVTLIGARAGLTERLGKLGEGTADYVVIDEPDDAAAARRAVALVRAGEAHIILKGRLKTGDLMRAVLHREEGLRTGNLLSDVLVAEDPVGGTQRIVGLTDGGLNVAPDLAAKKQILENAVRVFHRLGFACPKVACLCAIEAPTESQPHSLEARKLQEMQERGEITGCVVCGPLALDGALQPEAAKIKEINHPVAGCADILLMPSVEAGNALGKAFTYFAKRVVGHVIEGARAPVLIPSRVESAHDKLCSIAMGVLAAGGA
jgi:phosphate butyryltransferase